MSQQTSTFRSNKKSNCCSTRTWNIPRQIIISHGISPCAPNLLPWNVYLSSYTAIPIYVAIFRYMFISFSGRLFKHATFMDLLYSLSCNQHAKKLQELLDYCLHFDACQGHTLFSVGSISCEPRFWCQPGEDTISQALL